jgi:hypothetical protein
MHVRSGIHTATLVVLGLSLNSGIAAAQNCSVAIAAERVEWRALAKGNQNVPPAMRIVTSDGRHMTGSQINYARVLIDRADSASSNGGDTAAQPQLQEFQALIHPETPRR